MTYLSVHQQYDESLDTPVARTQNLARRLINLFAVRVRLINHRKHLKTLGKMNDQQLSDIGLERNDIYEASKLGRNIDVTCHLAGIAQRRRRSN